jgi:hypothetical protein
MAISRIFLFMRTSSSRLLSVRFVMRVHWIMRVCFGGIIIVPTAVVVSVSGFVSFWFIISVFQFWFSFIWFVAGLFCIRSVSTKNETTCWSLSCEISSVCAISLVLCHTLSLNKAKSFSSFVDTFLPSGKVSVREGLDLLISVGNF